MSGPGCPAAARTPGFPGRRALASGANWFYWIAGLSLVNSAIQFAGGFVLFGWLANRRAGWPFVVGMALYALDGLRFLMVREWLSLGFHAFALVGLAGGFAALRKLRALESPASIAAHEPIGV